MEIKKRVIDTEKEEKKERKRWTKESKVQTERRNKVQRLIEK
jgi:hypothetical protein